LSSAFFSHFPLFFLSPSYFFRQLTLSNNSSLHPGRVFSDIYCTLLPAGINTWGGHNRGAVAFDLSWKKNAPAWCTTVFQIRSDPLHSDFPDQDPFYSSTRKYEVLCSPIYFIGVYENFLSEIWHVTHFCLTVVGQVGTGYVKKEHTQNYGSGTLMYSVYCQL
jgi:hypothetical protein